MSFHNQCQTIVRGRINAVAGDPAHLSATQRAALASLRRGLGKPPGSVAEIWQFTLPDLEQDWRTAYRENAIHVALTHWAMHQQSKSLPMHREDRTFGQALRLLASSQATDRKKPEEAPAFRRMMALAASRNLTAITTHARGLIGQLRAAGFGFDYGAWAEDLFWIQVPGRAVDVQRRWGRDFYRLSDTAVDQTLDDSQTNPEPTSEGENR